MLNVAIATSQGFQKSITCLQFSHTHTHIWLTLIHCKFSRQQTLERVYIRKINLRHQEKPFAFVLPCDFINYSFASCSPLLVITNKQEEIRNCHNFPSSIYLRPTKQQLLRFIYSSLPTFCFSFFSRKKFSSISFHEMIIMHVQNLHFNIPYIHILIIQKKNT